jgi:TatD DNase family protein
MLWRSQRGIVCEVILLRRLKLSEETAGTCYATVGVHPCSTQQFDKHPHGPDAALKELKDLAIKARDSGHAVAFGEIGLDYDRLFLAPKESQLKYFETQLDVATELHMPLFLHSRACSEDFERLLKARLNRLPKRGLVHSFTGTIEEMRRIVEMGFDVGINGCSMKTEENVAVVKEVPLERLQIESDGPWVSLDASGKHNKMTDFSSVR